MKKARKKTGVVAMKHKLVIKNLLKNIGKRGKKITMVKAMTDAGYSQSYAEKGEIQKTKDWPALCEEFLSDESLAETHKSLLKSKQIRQLHFSYKLKDPEIKKIIEDEGYTFIGTKRFMTTAVVFFSAPDGLVVRGALDLAYKVRGKMAPDQLQVQLTELDNLSDDELVARKKALLARFKKID